MLGVLPIPIYLPPGENVARYLGRRAIGVGTTWAAEIQRAPLTVTEQFVKGCFDIFGAASALLIVLAVDVAAHNSHYEKLIADYAFRKRTGE